MHPVWGIELLATVEFPWDIKPIIRWHHEKYDGTGYPDRLQGDEIPLRRPDHLHRGRLRRADHHAELPAGDDAKGGGGPGRRVAQLVAADVYEAFIRSVGCRGQGGLSSPAPHSRAKRCSSAAAPSARYPVSASARRTSARSA